MKNRFRLLTLVLSLLHLDSFSVIPQFLSQVEQKKILAILDQHFDKIYSEKKVYYSFQEINCTFVNGTCNLTYAKGVEDQSEWGREVTQECVIEGIKSKKNLMSSQTELNLKFSAKIGRCLNEN